MHCTVVICFLGDTADIYKCQKCWPMPGFGLLSFYFGGVFSAMGQPFSATQKAADF